MASPKDVKDVLDTRREFFLDTPEGQTESYFIAQPESYDIRKADWQYSKVYNQAIVDGFLTQSQMVDLLKEKGILNEEYTDRIESVRINLAAELFKLENMPKDTTDEDREAIAMEVARLRDELFRLNQQVNGPMGNTCENLAEDARTEFLASRIVQTRDGERIWEEFEDYQNEGNAALAVKARFEVMLWMQGLNSNFLENTPEQEALREVAQNRLDQALEESKKLALEEAAEEEIKNKETSSTGPDESNNNLETKKPRKRRAKKVDSKDKPVTRKRGRPKKNLG